MQLTHRRAPLLGLAALAALALAAAQPSSAAPITYNLKNVTFSGGGTATGYFTYDPAMPNGSLGSYDIKTTSGGGLTGYSYTAANTTGSAASLAGGGESLLFTPNASHYPGSSLDFVFNAPLTGAGPYTLSTGSYEFSQSTFKTRYVATGTVSTPEPASWAAFAFMGFGAMALIIRARKRRAA